MTDDFAGLDIAGLDIDGLDNDGRITVFKVSYVLRHMKFTLISKNYEHTMSITWRVVY